MTTLPRGGEYVEKAPCRRLPRKQTFCELQRLRQHLIEHNPLPPRTCGHRGARRIAHGFGLSPSRPPTFFRAVVSPNVGIYDILHASSIPRAFNVTEFAVTGKAPDPVQGPGTPTLPITT